MSQVSPGFSKVKHRFSGQNCTWGPSQNRNAQKERLGPLARVWRTEEAAWCLAWLSQLKSKLVSYQFNLAPYPNTPPPLPASI